MYQLEVKRHLVKLMFLPSSGWKVTVDIDAMERAKGGSHPDGKAAVAAESERWLREAGVSIGVHPRFGRADLVAEGSDGQLYVFEIEGNSSKQKEQALYSALGQLLLLMNEDRPTTRFGLAVPDSPQWEKQLMKVPTSVGRRLNLSLFLVSPTGVRQALASWPNPAVERRALQATRPSP